MAALPYLAMVPVSKEDSGREGTIRHDRSRAFAGYNLYADSTRSEARLIEMDGSIVHRWSLQTSPPPTSEAGSVLPVPGRRRPGLWTRVVMTDKGELYAVVSRVELLKLDRRSKILWKLPLPVHHDIFIANKNTIYTLVSAPLVIQSGKRKRFIEDNEILILSPGGKVRRRISLYKLLSTDSSLAAWMHKLLDKRFEEIDRIGASRLIEQTKTEFKQAMERASETIAAAKEAKRPPGVPDLSNLVKGIAAQLPFVQRYFKDIREGISALSQMLSANRVDPILPGQKKPLQPRAALALLGLLPGQPCDLFHANSVAVLDRHPAGLWEAGNIMVSIRHMNLIVVVDVDKPRLVWAWGEGVIEGQHQPTVLPNGNLLIFDNGVYLKRSRVIEVDPRGRTIVWSYAGRPGKPFFTLTQGGAQLLSNDNILITLSREGRALEITRAGEIVWEYLAPLGSSPSGSARGQPDTSQHRQAIYRMTRYPRSVFKSSRAAR
jgi:hypothetical protein